MYLTEKQIARIESKIREIEGELKYASRLSVAQSLKRYGTDTLFLLTEELQYLRVQVQLS